MALTATATAGVKSDIVKSLGLQEPLLNVSASFNRQNLKYSVLTRATDNDILRVLLNMQALYERTQYDPAAGAGAGVGVMDAPKLFQSTSTNANDNNDKNKNKKAKKIIAFQSTLVYVGTKKEAEETCSLIQSSKVVALQNVKCGFYHAGLDSDQRRRVQEQFMNNEINIVVATVSEYA